MRLFDNYERQTSETKVLMVYLLLNDCSLERVKRLEEVEEDREFGLRLKKVYGLTEDHIDLNRIYREIEAVQNPIICSETSYEYYADAPYIYCYRAKDLEQPLLINDMGVISKTMVINNETVISDNQARSFMDGGAVSGFPFFKEYVMKNRFQVGKWKVAFDKSIFTIQYEDEILYSAFEIDKTSTYKMVIYLISKAAEKEDSIVGDNFICEKYRKKAS